MKAVPQKENMGIVGKSQEMSYKPKREENT